MNKYKFQPIVTIATLLTALLFIIGNPIKAGMFPAETDATHSYPGGDITLSKSAAWTDSNKKHAEVTLTFNGLSQVITTQQTADILFVLDTSASMASEGGCLNPAHYSAPVLNENAWERYGLTANEIADIVSNGAISGPLPKADDWNIRPNEQRIIDFSILLPVPQNPDYPNRAQLYLYLTRPDWTAPHTLKAADSTYLNASNWELVNFALEATGAEDYFLKPHLWWHYKLEQNGEKTRLGYTPNPNNAQINSFWNRGIYDENGIPKCWDMSDHGCYTRANSAYDALLSFSNDLLTAKPDSRIAFAAFNTAARNPGSTESTSLDLRTSNGFLEYTNDIATIEGYLDITLPFANGQTNYEAGLRSAQDILINDTQWDNNHEKILVFITDGMPNYICDSSTGAMTSGIAAQGATSTEKIANAFAPAMQVMAEIQRDFPDITVCTASFDVDDAYDLENFVKPLLTADGTHSFMNTHADGESLLKGTLSDFYNTQIFTKKLIRVTDIIDNRYFTVDNSVLNADGYLPENCTVEVQAEKIDTVDVQRVTFTYLVDMTQEAASLKIPLIFKIGVNAPQDNMPLNTDFFPTNYDPEGTNGGASCEYTYLDGTNETIETKKVWLQRNETYAFVLHDIFQDVDQAVNKGAVTLAEWHANVETDKDIFIENTGNANIYVRLKLTETLTGGDDNYNVQADPYIGCAPFNVYTPGMEADNPAYLAAFAEDTTLSHSIIEWTLDSPVFDLATWTGATGEFWLMDKTTGWAYWMKALTPEENTDIFLTSLCLKEEQAGICYTIDVEADAISAEKTSDVFQWTKDDYLENGKDVGDNISKIQEIFAIFHGEAIG